VPVGAKCELRDTSASMESNKFSSASGDAAEAAEAGVAGAGVEAGVTGAAGGAEVGVTGAAGGAAALLPKQGSVSPASPHAQRPARGLAASEEGGSAERGGAEVSAEDGEAEGEAEGEAKKEVEGEVEVEAEGEAPSACGAGSSSTSRRGSSLPRCDLGAASIAALGGRSSTSARKAEAARRKEVGRALEWEPPNLTSSLLTPA